MALDFSSLGSEGKKKTTTKRVEPSGEPEPEPALLKDPKPTPSRASRTKWKNKYEDVKSENELLLVEVANLKKGIEIGKNEYQKLLLRINELEGPIADELDMYRQQEAQQKQAIDILTQKLEKFQFNIPKFIELMELLSVMRLHGGEDNLAVARRIVGDTQIKKVRKWIYDLLEAPYR